jgi:hypothetical protein
LFATVAPKKLASRELDASVGASEPHDFAVRKPRARQVRRLRPPHPVPYVRDDRETPLCVGRDGEGYAGDLRQKGMEIFLKEGLDMQITFFFFRHGRA